MSLARTKDRYPGASRAPFQADAIEWEELPSLAELVARRTRVDAGDSGPAAFPVWDETVPVELDAVRAPPQPFREAFEGLAVRELTTPDLFRHFFGGTRSA